MKKPVPIVKHALTIMKITVLQILIAVGLSGLTIASPEDSYGQGILDNTLSISAENKKLGDILSRIEKLAHVKFSFNPKTIPLKEKVSVNLQDAKLKDVLGDLLEPLRINYEVSGDYVILSKPLITASADLTDSLNKMRMEVYALSISGTVTSETGEFLPGANVIQKGTTYGTATDADGRYSLSVSDEDAVLVFSFIGYISQEVAVNGRSVVDVVLLGDVQSLDEVVVVGYGTQKKIAVTGSISSVDGATLQQSPAANLSNSIVGHIPGVIINNRSGEPGRDASSILIRGKGTLNDNSPLIVIDGIANRGDFDRLNPDDIESINVLKDASAAIYGAQAANGVILVTTKRGRSGKPTITYNGSYGFTEPTRLPDLVNAWQYATYENEIASRDGLPPLFSDEQIQGYRDGNDPLNFPNTNWVDAVIKDLSPQSRHSLSVRGGGEKINYFISGGYLHQDGIFENSATYYNQFNLRSNIDAHITENFKVSLDMSGRLEDRNYSNISGTRIFGYTFGTFPTLPAFYPNGLPGAGVEAGRNPVLMASGETGYEKMKDYFLQSMLSFELNLPFITEGLFIGGHAAYDFHSNHDKLLNDNWDAYSYNRNTDIYTNYRTLEGPINLSQGLRNFELQTYHFKIGYDRSFDEHSISAFAGYEQSENYDEGIRAFRTGFLTSQIDQISLGGNTGQNNAGTAGQSARQNIFGRVSYNFNDKYLAEFILRYDGSFNFPKNRQWGTFPGVSVGWRISEEPFFKDNIAFVNGLKLKASWGKLGNDKISPYQHVLQYNIDEGYYFGSSVNRVAGLSFGVVPNPYVTWEVADSKNIGIESSLWNGMLNVNADYFFSKRTNILLPRNASIPTSTGLNSSNLPAENIGKVNNHGYELEVLHRRSVTNDLSYSIGLNFTHAVNKVVYMDEAAGIPEWQKIEGHPMDSWLLYKTDGLYKTQAEIDESAHLAGSEPGDIRYIDVDEDGSISADDMVRIYESATPLNTYGIPMGITYKGFGLDLLWQGQGSAQQVILPNGNPRIPPVWMFQDRWTPDNPNGTMPAAFSPSDNINNSLSEFWLRDAAFLRLKTLELSYTFPKEMLSQLNLQNLNFYINGFNLLTFSEIKDYDPELSASNGAYYPHTRIFNVGIRISL